MQRLNASHKIILAVIATLYATACVSFWPETPRIKAQHDTQLGDLQARFFGTSTLWISDGFHSVMIDGFFTRQGYLETLISRMKSNQKTVNDSLRKAQIKKVDYLLISHNHYDHALDAETTALATDAIMMAPEQTRELSPTIQSIAIDTAKTITNGSFQLSFYETTHVKKSRFFQLVEQWVLWSTGGTRFKSDEQVYSFFLQHPQANILIIPSAGFPENIILPATADIVFLGIGLLANQSDQYINDYWQRAVVDSCAKWVIPIHWDNFTRPLTKPLEPSPAFIDDIDKTLKMLSELALHSECTGSAVQLSLPPVFDPFGLQRPYAIVVQVSS